MNPSGQSGTSANNASPVPAASRDWFRATTTRAALLSLVLVAVTLAVFWPVTRYDFVNFDDGEFFNDNLRVQQGLTWSGVLWAFQPGHGDYWHPLTWLSLMLDVSLFGSGPRGPHTVNLLLHTANAVLLLLLLWRLTGAVWRSFFVAALFALHPLHVESVAWITERKDVLSLFFGFLALICYVRYAQRAGTVNTQQTTRNFLRAGSYWLALLFFAMALMSKAMLVTLPLVMLLLDYWPLNRINDSTVQRFNIRRLRRLLFEKLPFLLLSSASAITTYLTAQGSLAADGLPFTVRIETAVVAYVRYLVKTVWPVNLAVFYPHPGQWALQHVAISALVLALISVWALWMIRRQPAAFVGWCWFLVTLLPVIGLVQVGSQAMADRFTYLPLIGVFILLAWLAGDWLAQRTSPVAGRWLPGVVALIVVALAARTHDQLKHWQDGETLFRHALAVTEKNPVAHNSLGMALLNKGQPDEAAREFQAALALNPNDPLPRRNLGVALVRLGQVDEAIEQFAFVLERHAGDATAWGNLSEALSLRRLHDKAIAAGEMAVRISPESADNRVALANALADAGRVPEAVEQYQQALQLSEGHFGAHSGLGVILATGGRTTEAVEHFRASLRSKSDEAATHDNLGSALAMLGQLDEAVIHFAEALRLDPRRLGTRMNYGNALASRNQYDKAVEQFTEVLRVAPGFAPAHKNLGITLLRLGRTNEAVIEFRTALRLDPRMVQARKQLEALGVPALQ